MVSEVSFLRFWRVLSIEKWSPFFVSVIGSAVSEILRFARFFGKCANRDISETALLITETKNGDHFAIVITPQNLGKLNSETTFGHSKVVFRPLLRTKRAFSQNPVMARF